MWAAVTKRFSLFHADLNPTPEQVADAFGKARRVGQALERAYNGGVATETPPVFPVGSWGKGTQVRPSADIDIMAKFDWSIYRRFHSYAHNGQSALLQEVKGHLEQSFSQTRMRGDGQVVQIDFNSIMVEVVPVFPLDDNGQFIMPDTHDAGSWKIVDPVAQISYIDALDKENNGNVRALSKMIKRWKHEQEVDLKSFLIELIVADFVRQCDWGKCSYFWYDWLVRDCFKFMRTRAAGWATVPGTGEVISIGDAWVRKVEAAVAAAETACAYEQLDSDVLAGMEWQKIFGPRIPMQVL